MSLFSEALGLEVRVEIGVLCFYDLGTDRKLLTYEEINAVRQAVKARARSETEARQAAEARVAELEARLRAIQGDPPPPFNSGP